MFSITIDIHTMASTATFECPSCKRKIVKQYFEDTYIRTLYAVCWYCKQDLPDHERMIRHRTPRAYYHFTGKLPFNPQSTIYY